MAGDSEVATFVRQQEYAAFAEQDELARGGWKPLNNYNV